MSGSIEVAGMSTEGCQLRPQFMFLAIETPDDSKTKAFRRRAKSHAIRQALLKKRKLESRSTPLASAECARNRDACIPAPSPLLPVLSRTPSSGALDPFMSLAADSNRLQELLSLPTARQSTEPVFNIANEVVFQNFRCVFRCGLEDPALLNAIMLTLAFAASGGVMTKECLEYATRAVAFVGKRISDLDWATIEATLGAILLLAGVDYRLGMRSQVQLHLNGVQQLISCCKSRGIPLTHGLKRAIFWQDLNAATITGSERTLDHTSFSELHWKRDPLLINLYSLPPGFLRISHLLTEELIDIIKDTHAFQQISALYCESAHFDAISTTQIDNQQAWIESRIQQLTIREDLELKSCCLTLYLCTYLSCTTVWQSVLIPSRLSSQILKLLQASESSSLWDPYGNLYTWILYMGGAFARSVAKHEYLALLRKTLRKGPKHRYSSWTELHNVLCEYIWWEATFSQPVRNFWEEGIIYGPDAGKTPEVVGT